MWFDMLLVAISPSTLSNFCVAHRFNLKTQPLPVSKLGWNTTKDLILLLEAFFTWESWGRTCGLTGPMCGEASLPSVTLSLLYPSPELLRQCQKLSGDFITVPWCNHPCSNLGAKFGSRYFGPVATEELLCWLLCSRKLVEEAEMSGWGCIFLERGSQSQLEHFLVLLSVPSDPVLMGYGGDPCVALPAQTVHVFPAVIYWKLRDRQLGKLMLFCNC